MPTFAPIEAGLRDLVVFQQLQVDSTASSATRSIDAAVRFASAAAMLIDLRAGNFFSLVIVGDFIESCARRR